jgi:hypothetical protein
LLDYHLSPQHRCRSREIVILQKARSGAMWEAPVALYTKLNLSPKAFSKPSSTLLDIA